ncbi:MAG: hypothetical protein K0R57_2383 [Paenibacillaceae bacterium]|jgi:hypothetical protein|nr:hypothetical protein [Paenibacillaceae bacterium]
MDLFHNRYQLEHSWKRINKGWFATAKDTKLERDVLLWREDVAGQEEREELIRRLGNAARFSQRSFVHILDVSVAGNGVYAVLTKGKGLRLTEQLRHLKWSDQEILQRLLELIPAIREARRERLQDFSVTAENIWMDGAGKLRLINSWTEAEKEQRDVYGLTMLLYQLCTGQEVLPGSIREFNQAISGRLTGLPGGDAQEAVDWASSAFLPSCSLRDYEAGIVRLLAPTVPYAAPVKEPGAAARSSALRRKDNEDKEVTSQRRQQEVRVTTTPPRAYEDEQKDGRRLHPWIYFTLAIVFVGFLAVGGLWFVIRDRGADENDAVAPSTQATASAISANSASPSEKTASSPNKTPAPSKAPASPGKTPVSSPVPSGGNVSATPKPPSAAVQATPSRNSDNAAADTANAVPDLVNHTLEEASRMALASGLRYQYYVEASELPKDTVFKQDLVPGTVVSKGDTVIFWVSRGP